MISRLWARCRLESSLGLHRTTYRRGRRMYMWSRDAEDDAFCC